MCDIISEFRGQWRWLSNFWPAPVKLDREVYPTVEHAYQAAKTLDLEARKIIREASTPGIAKKLGRHLDIRADWDEVRDGVMRDLLKQKFAPGTALAEQLLATGRWILVEGNNWGDTYWGISNGTGLNRLGSLLMEVRLGLLIQKGSS